MVLIKDYVMPASPLCSAIPLEGSDNVLGLSRLLGSRLNSGSGLRQTLTFQNFSDPPKHWKDFFGWRNGIVNMAFSYPSQPESVEIRLENNFSKFMPNYLQVLALTLALFLYMSSWAVAGLLASLLIHDAYRMYVSQHGSEQNSLEMNVVRMVSHALMWAFAYKSHGLHAICLGLLLGGVLVFLHALLRTSR